MVPFKQGVLTGKVTASTKPTPDYIFTSRGGAELGIHASPSSPVKIVFSHGPQHDYMFVEDKTIPKAWVGFQRGIDYWIYWDLDLYTGERTFGSTTVEPMLTHSHIPSDPVEGMHWYDKSTQTMKVYVSGIFTQRVRVFAAKYQIGKPIEYFKFGSQVGVTQNTDPHFITFDYTRSPIRDIVNGKSKFKSSKQKFTQVASSASTCSIESITDPQLAQEQIPAFSLVAQVSSNRVGLASSTLALPGFGITVGDTAVNGDVVVVTEGYVTNEQWNFDAPVGSHLFCGNGGQILLQPVGPCVQSVGILTSPNTMLVKIRQPIYVAGLINGQR